MSGIFEQLLAEQVKTNSLLAQILAGKGTSSSTKPTETGDTTGNETETAAQKKARLAKEKKDAEAKNKPKHTKSEVTDMVVSVKEALGAPAAKELLGNHGIDKLVNITEDKFDAVYAEAEALLADSGDGAEGDDDI